MTEPGKKLATTNIAKRLSHLEAELQRTIDRYELVWQATNDVLYDLHIDSGQVTWNDALYRQFGYGKHEVTNTLEWWVSHIHPEDALHVEQLLNDWFSSGDNTWRSEYRFLKGNGQYSHVLDRGYLLRNPDGTPQRIIGSLLDISDLRQLERAKDEFISLVSHQLRTPLTVIRVYGEMLTNGFLGTLTAPQTAHITRMTNASVRLIKLVDDILNAARIEIGKYEVRRKWIDIHQLITQSIEDARVLAVPKGISITYQPIGVGGRVLTDPDILRQIIENLLTNAVRYTTTPKGNITVSCYVTKTELHIIVADNGIGIPRAEQKHVFERFYRAHNAINIEEHGTGLGLYLVEILTRLLCGHVWFESSTKRGTTFHLSLPME